jgi:hypothetical protein
MFPFAIVNMPTGLYLPWFGTWNAEQLYPAGAVVWAPGPRQRLDYYAATQTSQAVDPNGEDGWVYWVPAVVAEAERDTDVAGFVIATESPDDLKAIGEWVPGTYTPGTITFWNNQLLMATEETDTEPIVRDDEGMMYYDEDTDQWFEVPTGDWYIIYQFVELP